jgi:hypothetical protein
LIFILRKIDYLCTLNYKYMPSRTTKQADVGTSAKVPGAETATKAQVGAVKGATIQSSPLKIASHKFLTAAGLMGVVKEETERMTKAEDVKVPTLYVTFENDGFAHKAAMAFLQEGDDYGGTADELLMVGFPKNEPEDDLIVMFQFVGRETGEVPLGLTSPEKAAKALIAEVGDVPYTFTLTKERGLPRGILAEFTRSEDAAMVAYQYMSTDTNEGEKANPLFVIGEKGVDTILAFYTVAGAK